MGLALYMDHNVPRAVTTGLRLRGVDVLTAYEDGTSEIDDSELLDRSTELERVLFTRDDDLLSEAVYRALVQLNGICCYAAIGIIRSFSQVSPSSRTPIATAGTCFVVK